MTCFMEKKEKNIEWDENGTPIALRFDDPYYSKRDGRAESNHVFIQGNDLITRFEKTESLHTAELGFGTGLNFLETLNLWKKIAQKEAKLFYTSFELYPLDIADIQKALVPWPDLAKYFQPFEEQYAQQTGLPGFYELSHENVTLCLAIGDANQLVPKMTNKADAWYLDGFSPAKNPELWNEALMKAVYEKTSKGGTFATYSAAGWVRKMLEEAGFQVERIKGFAAKKHMSIGKKL